MDVVIESSDGPKRNKLELGDRLLYACIEIPRNIKQVKDMVAFAAGVLILLHAWTGKRPQHPLHCRH